MKINEATPSLYTSTSKPAGRIRQKNEELILAAAAEEFARYGFRGTSMKAIALRAELPKANLHYYFSSKLSLYVEVMRDILELWDSAFDQLTVEDDPATALAGYIRTKMEFSRKQPQASKIFAMEVISGCECLSEHFNQDYRNWFRNRAAVFEAWIAAGKMDRVDPMHLIFLIWSSTQHYADFSDQIKRLTDSKHITKADFELGTKTLIQVILKGCGLMPLNAVQVG